MVGAMSMPVMLAGALVAFGAGVVRGFAGFGFAALTVAGLSLFVTPAAVVPAVLTLEVLASVGLMRSAAPDVDRGWLRWLLIGNALFVPLGIALLVLLPQTLVRLLVGAVLLVAAVGLLLAGERTLGPGRGLRVVAGVASGLLNGIAASGGVAVAMLMTAARLAPVVMRATIITYLFYAGVYAIVCAGLLSRGTQSSTELLGAATLQWGLVLAPAMFAGIWIGQRSFGGADPARYRRFVLALLVAVAGLGVARASVELLSGA